MKISVYIEIVSVLFLFGSACINAADKPTAFGEGKEIAADTSAATHMEPAAGSLVLKEDSSASAAADSTSVDSVQIRFIPGMGQLYDNLDTSGVFFPSEMVWTDAKYAGDLIWKLPGFFWRDLGEPGKWGELNAYGTDMRDISLLLDGRPMNDPVVGTYNMYDLPLEFISGAEVASCASSPGAANGRGTALNFVTRFYNSYRPMTKIRYVEHSKGSILTDGIFTQNVARGLNLMIGIQRHVTQGRYANADLDSWNVRMRLRYNISGRINVSLTDFYTMSSNGLNYGVDASQSISIFDELGTHVINDYARDRRTRRDVTFSMLARLLPDSSATRINIYYSGMVREFWNPMELGNRDDSTVSAFWGINLQQEMNLPLVYFSAGGSWERRKSDSTRTLAYHAETEKSLFARAELRVVNSFVPFASLQSVSLNGENTLNKGAGVKFRVGKWAEIFYETSWYDRFPTIQEKYRTDSTIFRTSGIVKEQHVFSRTGIDLKISPGFRMELSGFDRKIEHPIVYEPAVTMYGSRAIGLSNESEVRIQGICGKLDWHWHQLEFFGVFTLTRYKQSDMVRTRIPDAILGTELSYRDLFFKGKLDAKFGIRSRFYNRQESMKFDPQTLAYVQYYQNIIGRSTTLDLFMILKIGDAHVSLSFENLLNAKYIMAPVYPMPGRNLRLGVNWIFMD